VVVAALSLASCTGDEPVRRGPETLSTPNGAPKNEGLHGPFVPGAVWYRGHAYANTGIIAHLKGGDQPFPSFLREEGVARYAVGGLHGPLRAGPWDTALPVYSRVGASASRVLVAQFGLVGERATYTLYYAFRRE
jgi:hypothetical protein